LDCGAWLAYRTITPTIHSAASSISRAGNDALCKSNCVTSRGLPIIMRPMLDFERAAADAQGRVSAEDENAGRSASAVLPGREGWLRFA
jgi:hypothetical protein